jgi:saccharopine dehydrogenase-like NADP-dependent oxidoreductase
MASPVVARAPAAAFGAHSLASSRRVGSRRALRGDVRRRSPCERRVSHLTVVSDGKKVVFVGGTGRVGSSAAAALLKQEPGASIVLAGRSDASFAAAVERHPSLRSAAFARCDSADPASLASAIQGADLVVHSAGPFQGGGDECAVLNAAIDAKVPYLDVCDDAEYAKKCKSRSPEAAAAGVPCVTTGGIYPGVSNLMAAEMIDQNRASIEDAGGESDGEVEYVLYNYFCAGSGGVGDTILATSYMLCGEDVVCWDKGEKVVTRPATQRKVVDFGKKCGKREVFLYNLPEVASAREVWGAETVKARFGTSPGLWNGAMALMAGLVPKETLLNKETARTLATFTAPIVRAVDAIVGERTAIRVDVKLKDGALAGSIYNHPKLSEAVGDATAAFVCAMLRGETDPGVWYPEEPGAVKDRSRVLEAASAGCSNFEMNKAAWMLESKPINLGFGMYLEL